MLTAHYFWALTIEITVREMATPLKGIRGTMQPYNPEDRMALAALLARGVLNDSYVLLSNFAEESLAKQKQNI